MNILKSVEILKKLAPHFVPRDAPTGMAFTDEYFNTLILHQNE
jgi:hypothetical protein